MTRAISLTAEPPNSARRGELDGLRGIAVLAVLVFHLDPDWLPGGFAGVDIFFVLSGFLITQTLVKNGISDLKAFYLRRFWRLFPALSVTLFGTLIAGWWLWLPIDYMELAKSALAAQFGLSNFWFAGTLDYFNQDALFHPLLHTWSLGVEEQFYLIWPWILALLFLAQRPQIWVITLTVALVITSLFWQNIDSQSAYYMMPTRAFQLTAGACVALLAREGVQLKVRWLPQIQVLSLSAVLAVLILAHKSTVWPGPVTIALTISVLPLLLKAEGYASRTLNLAGLPFIGKISYSLYLVHWPTITMTSSWLIIEPDLTTNLLIGIFCLTSGFTLYVFVERPFQQNISPWKALNPIDFISQKLAKLRAPLTIGIFVCGCALSIWVLHIDGAPNRFDNIKVQPNTNAKSDFSFGGDQCSTKANRCLFGNRSGGKTVYLIGDSHALNLVRGLDALFLQNDIRGIAIYAHGCAFLKGWKTYSRGNLQERCETARPDAFQELKRSDHPIIWVGAWQLYEHNLSRVDEHSPRTSWPDSYKKNIIQELASTLQDFSNRAILLPGPIPIFSLDPRACLRNPGTGPNRCGTQPKSDPNIGNTDWYDALTHLADHSQNITLLDQRQPFCSERECFIDQDGVIFFRDSTHLTNDGSLRMVEQFGDQILKKLLQ